jgi:NADH-quinone oxidoreductase subunit N
LLAAILTAALLSGWYSNFAGFFAKLVLFSQTIQAGYLALVIVAVVNSIISVGYYFKLILAMYTKEPNEERKGTPVIIYAVAIVAVVEYCVRVVPIFSFGFIGLNKNLKYENHQEQF